MEGSDPLAADAADWTFACPDWWERLQAGRSLLPDLPLDPAKCERAVKIFNKLVVPDIAGTPSFGEAAGDWFRDIIRAVFGSLDEAGVRHVAEVFALVGKKNSKTTNGGALMITALLLNEVPRGEFLFIGPTQEIAELAFSQAAGMIEADPEGYLQKRFQIRDHLKTITDRRNKAFIKIKTFDMKVMTGARPIGVLIDELHVMSAMHYAGRVLRQVRGALESKPNSFLLIITTQSDEPPAGVFRAELQYARGVRDGRVKGNVRMLPMLWEFPEALQTDEARLWADPRYWPMVMPNLGRSLHLETMKSGYEAAREKGEEEERRWASQHLNVEIGLALHADRWRGADFWLERADEVLSADMASLARLDALLERCEVATAGVDGGGLDDLLGLVVIGREIGSGRWLVWGRAWAHPLVLERRKDIAPRLKDFAAEGDLVICEAPTQDIEDLADIVARVRDAGVLPKRYGVGLDPLGVGAIIDALAERDLEVEANGGPVCAVTQGYRLSGAVWGMERKLADGTLVHCGQALMAWAVGNARIERRGNAVVVTKEASGVAKIDPLVAAFNAFQLLSRGPAARGQAAIY